MGDVHKNLPFKVGQLAEARSFLSGFRGAWFRCKIKEISVKNGHIGHAFEFFDFPDEKIRWTKIYQRPPIYKNKSTRDLMVRPPFPPVYRESQIPDFNTVGEVTVIVDDVWRVGDLVDWWTDGCYWCAMVTQLLDDNKATSDVLYLGHERSCGDSLILNKMEGSMTILSEVHIDKIQFPDPPLGEGLSYDVCCKDLRPSLDWSPKYGWTVPIPKEGENRRRCARLVQPTKQASSVPPPDGSMHSPTKGMGKQSSGIPEFKEHSQETNMDLDIGDSSIAKASCSDSVSSSLFRDASDSMAGTTSGKDQYCNGGSSKKMRSGGSIPLNIECSDTLEAAILDLEELANKVRWLKGVLEFGIPLSNAIRPSWKFLEHRAPPSSK